MVHHTSSFHHISHSYIHIEVTSAVWVQREVITAYFNGEKVQREVIMAYLNEEKVQREVIMTY